MFIMFEMHKDNDDDDHDNDDDLSISRRLAGPFSIGNEQSSTVHSATHVLKPNAHHDALPSFLMCFLPVM